MGSSSDLEIVSKPLEGRGARTRRAARPRAELPSPAAKRIAPARAKATTTKVTKGKGKAKSQTIISDEDDSDADLLPTPRKPRSPSKTSTMLEIPTSDTVAPAAFSSDPPAASLGAQLPRSASTSAAAGSVKRTASSNSHTTVKATKMSQSPAPSRSDLPKSSSAPVLTKRAPAPKESIVLGGESSDETDDFFLRKPAAVAPKRVPGRKPTSSQVAGSSVHRPGPRKMVASATSDSSDSDTSMSGSSSPEAEDRDASLAAAVKHSKLPEWTRNVGKATTGLSGSAARMANKPNRKKRRLDLDSDEEAKLEAEETAKRVAAERAEDTDDSFASGSDTRIRKGKGKMLVPDREDSRSPTPAPVETRSLKDIIAEAKAALTSPKRDTSVARPFIAASTAAPHDEDEDLSHLAPELLRIRNASRRSAAPPTSDDDFHIVPAAKESSLPLEAEEEDQKTTTIRVSLVMDPERGASEMAKKGYEREMPVQIGMKQSFSHLFNSVGTMRTIDPNSLVLTYRRNRVYPFGTPDSLKIHPDIGADFKGYTMDVWEKIETARKEGRVLGAAVDSGSQGALGSQPRPASTGPFAAVPAPVAAADDDDDDDDSGPKLLHLTIRGSATQSVALAVKPSTLISALLRKYCKQFSIPEERQKKMWLEFDGDRLDSSKKLEDYEDEIEDEETVDVGEAKV